MPFSKQETLALNDHCVQGDLTPDFSNLLDASAATELSKAWWFWGNRSQTERQAADKLVRVFNEFCESRNLTYFLHSGTLLGKSGAHPL